MALTQKDLLAIREIVQSEVGPVREDVSTLREDVSTLSGDVSTLREDVSALGGDVSTLREDVSALGGDVSTLREDVSTLGEDVSTLHEDVRSIKLKLENDIEPKLQLSIEGNVNLDRRFDEQQSSLEAIAPAIQALDILHRMPPGIDR